MPAMSQRDRRQSLLASIHLLAKELEMDEDAYRACLYDNFRVRTAGVLNDGELASFADGLRRTLRQRQMGANAPYPGRPHNIEDGRKGTDGESSRSRQMRKIEALLTEAKRPWAYADTLAQRICKVSRVAWVKEGDLYKIIAALEKDAKRHGRWTG